MAAASTHPDHRVAQKEDINSDQFLDDLNAAIEKSVAQNNTSYTRVTVWLLAWKGAYDTNDVSIRDDLDEFKDLMSTQYRYNTDVTFLHEENGPQRVRNIMRKTVKMLPKEDELLIVYYVGHALYHSATRHSLFCAKKEDDTAQTVSLDFHRYIAGPLEHSAGDVLYIIDACHATSVGIDQSREVLAATAVDVYAYSREHGNQTFTQALCQILEQYPGPTTIAQVHGRLIYYALDPVMNLNLETTPVHVADSKPEKASIILAAMQPSGQSQPDIALTSIDANAHILLEVSLADPPPNTAEFTKWLTTNLPKGLTGIRIESLYQGQSCKMVIRLPVFLWDMLLDRTCYVFVDHVRGPNLLLEQQARLERLLASANARISELETQVRIGGGLSFAELTRSHGSSSGFVSPGFERGSSTVRNDENARLPVRRSDENNPSRESRGGKTS